MKYEPNEEGHLPIVMQPPCQPDKARLIGYAPSWITGNELNAILKRAGIEQIMDAKLIRSKKRGDRWSVVALLAILLALTLARPVPALADDATQLLQQQLLQDRMQFLQEQQMLQMQQLQDDADRFREQRREDRFDLDYDTDRMLDEINGDY